MAYEDAPVGRRNALIDYVVWSSEQNRTEEDP